MTFGLKVEGKTALQSRLERSTCPVNNNILQLQIINPFKLTSFTAIQSKKKSNIPRLRCSVLVDHTFRCLPQQQSHFSRRLRASFSNTDSQKYVGRARLSKTAPRMKIAKTYSLAVRSCNGNPTSEKFLSRETVFPEVKNRFYNRYKHRGLNKES